MDPSTIIFLLIFGVFIFLGYKKDKEKQERAQKKIAHDTKLYENIKKGKREFNWRMETDKDNFRSLYWKTLENEEPRALLFETADMIAFSLWHRPETRIGFYFKDINEYGLYTSFVGNDPENDFFEMFYRSDEEFKTKQILIYDDE
jgi:hypothetical protein